MGQYPVISGTQFVYQLRDDEAAYPLMNGDILIASPDAPPRVLKKNGEFTIISPSDQNVRN